MEESLLEIYQKRVQEFTSNLDKYKKIRSRLGWIRLFAIVISFALGFYFFPRDPFIAAGIIVVGLIAFLAAVSADAKNNAKISSNERMLLINNEEISIHNHKYNHRENGLAYLPHEHPYAADLDLFGDYSLYQYINRCTSAQAKELLSQQLMYPLSFDAIIEQQEAIKELTPNLHWRQETIAAGLEHSLTKSTEIKIESWLQSVMPYSKKIWSVVLIIYPLITLGSLAAFLFDYISSQAFSGLVGLYFITGLLISKNILLTYASLTKIENEIGTLRKQLLHFEQLEVTSPLLVLLKQNMQDDRKASDNIHELTQVLNRFDYRLNILAYFVLNSFLLWDLRQVIALRTWRNKNGKNVAGWIKTIAHIEVLNSLSTLAYNHPSWVYPTIVLDHFTFSATNVGHPLIDERKRVDNSFATKGTGRVSIITGSNMAGKSTFLRSVGVNVVLAQMGTVICASSFTLSPVQLYTSMRVTDNLAENTSTFYAELKKLKSIIDAVKKQEKIFILLDEILRGTNSLDRHTGSKALIKQLIGQSAVAVIATHDVELAALEKSYITSIKNYHFDVQVEGEELYFDYKLKNGVCQSLNASLLMKKIGIEI